MAERLAKMSEIRALGASELRQRIADGKRAIIELRLKARQGALQKPHEIRVKRREVAQMATALTEVTKRA